MIDWISRQKDTYVIGLGDYIDAINITDKRFDPDCVGAEFRDVLGRLAQAQTQKAVELLIPLKDKIIGLGIGNHEMTIAKRYHYDVMVDLCGKLGVKYLGWTSITRLRIERPDKHAHVISLFAEHTHWGGRKKGSKLNRAEDRSNDFDCDIFLSGHSHDKVCDTKTQIYVPTSGELKMREKKKVYCICPSFYNAYEEGSISYAEVAGYSPTSTGVVRIDITVSHEKGIDYHLYS